MLFGQIFLYYYIIKVLPRLTLYRLKNEKGGRAPYVTLPPQNYALSSIA
jgi:hypothetical protein